MADMADEFRSAEPLTPVIRHPKGSGKTIDRAGTYLCKNCEDALNPPRTYLEAGEELPNCPSCGKDTQWQWCSADRLHC